MHVLRAAERAPSKSRTVRFEGAAYGTDISFFAVDSDPGQGPVLHTHPYAETWFVQEGRARFVADGKVLEVGPGDIVVAPGGTAHKFTNIGDGRLVMFCVHDTGTMAQENLE